MLSRTTGAPEFLTRGLLQEFAPLAEHIGRRIGVGGAAVWRAISHREITPSGVRYDANSVDECYVDEASLVPGAPLDGSIPGLELVRAFEDRIVEKLWVFNAGHAAAAYLGWHAGCETIDQAMAHKGIRAAVSAVVREAQQALEAYLAARPGSVPIPARGGAAAINPVMGVLVQDLEASGAMVDVRVPEHEVVDPRFCSTPAHRISCF